MTTAAKVQGKCSVCLREMQLNSAGVKPIRHGFTAVGVRHGQNSGYHTGPCQGTRFPHLGISNEGTVWALDNARTYLAANADAIANLATNPDLIWHPRNLRGFPELSRPVTLRYGQDVSSSDGRPSYAWEHRKRMDQLINLKDELERAISAYERVLATWKPEAATAAPVKVETMHMTRHRVHALRGEWDGVTCRFTRPGLASNKLSKTTDTTKVNCKRCKAAIGLP